MTTLTTSNNGAGWRKLASFGMGTKSAKTTLAQLSWTPSSPGALSCYGSLHKPERKEAPLLPHQGHSRNPTLTKKDGVYLLMIKNFSEMRIFTKEGAKANPLPLS